MPDGQDARCRQFSCAPMRDAAVAITGAVAIVRDMYREQADRTGPPRRGPPQDEFSPCSPTSSAIPRADPERLFVIERSEAATRRDGRSRSSSGKWTT